MHDTDHELAYVIADAISIKIIADTPDNSGPFVLEWPFSFDQQALERVQAAWKEAFRLAGRHAPPLLVLSDGAKLRAVTEVEKKHE
jgi:hypothetical protein